MNTTGSNTMEGMDDGTLHCFLIRAHHYCTCLVIVHWSPRYECSCGSQAVLMLVIIQDEFLKMGGQHYQEKSMLDA